MSLIFFTVSASAPMTVLAGGVVATFAVTGSVGVPLSFPILALSLALFAVGYAAMSRYVSNAGAFYAYLAQGLGRAWGVAGSFVALVAYNAIQIGLYGLFGAALQPLAKDKLHVNLPWWGWALIALVVVGTLGILRVDLNAKVLAVLLIMEIAAVLLFDIGAFGSPAGGQVSGAGLSPSNLFDMTTIGGVFAFGIAAFVGFESAAVYSEEAKDPRRTVARATYAALAVTGVLYTISAWALEVGVGTDQVVKTTQTDGPGAVFGLIGQHFGAVVADLANVLLITSVFAALLSFHNGVARYLFALGRERVLPQALARTGARSGAPVYGSLIQSLLALVVVAIFVVSGQDPVATLFTWLSYSAAVGVLLLMVGTSVAVIGFFHGRDVPETAWQRTVAPLLGAFVLAVITGVTMYNSDSVLGTAKGSALTWILPGIVVVAALAGLLWGMVLRSRRPEVYTGIGRGLAQSPIAEATAAAV
ncbi:MAG TPA: APC family permease [Micromonosporaceae bacterium]